MSSLYSINIYLPINLSNSIFKGYFNVNNTTNLVIGFYENNNFSNNLLINTGTTLGKYLNFNTYTYTNGSILYDNAYMSNWLQFDYYGVIISGMSYFNSINFFNLWATTIGNETLNNTGYIISPSNVAQQNVVFNIIPLSSDPSCFNYNTKILSLTKYLEEKYIPIQDLQKGDYIKTYLHGYKKIDCIGSNDMINNINKNELYACMYVMKKSTKNELIEDLIITGSHSILVDNLTKEEAEKQDNLKFNVKIDNKYLLLACVSNKFIKLEELQLYTYYHFTLENDGDDNKRYGVWSNGILSEIPSKNQFITHKYIIN